MVYVIAVEEDGYMRDVTPRYAKQYSAKVAKVQSGGKGRREWWSQVIQMVTRPYKLVGNSCFLFVLISRLRRRSIGTMWKTTS
jgi:hypothetical protein